MERSENPADASLVLEYVIIKVDVRAMLGDKELVRKLGIDELPHLPVLVNSKAIKKGTRLLAQPDVDANAAHDADVAMRARQAMHAEAPAAKKSRVR